LVIFTFQRERDYHVWEEKFNLMNVTVQEVGFDDQRVCFLDEEINLMPSFLHTICTFGTLSHQIPIHDGYFLKLLVGKNQNKTKILKINQREAIKDERAVFNISSENQF
jgi:hypothetical protein